MVRGVRGWWWRRRKGKRVETVRIMRKMIGVRVEVKVKVEEAPRGAARGEVMVKVKIKVKVRSRTFKAVVSFLSLANCRASVI